MNRQLVVPFVVLIIVCSLAAESRAVTEPAPFIEMIKSVSNEGKGNVEAAEAARTLAKMDASVLPLILKEFDDANPLAANWLRNAFETIAARQVKAGTLPAKQLKAFVLDTERNPRARRMVYEWLLKVDPGLKDELIPGMLMDPSPEFRRDAVARLIKEAESQNKSGKGELAIKTFETALSGAVHEDQVKSIVEPLRKLGREVDLPKHFGFVMDWHIIGPFDNRDKKGFPVSYPPEKEVKLDAKYEGQLGEVSWHAVQTDDDYGVVDIAEKIHNYKGSVMYATSVFVSDADQDVQFRLGTPNAWKLWVNDEKLFEREEYHRGTRFDQYRVTVHLRQGDNRILLKICQNEQEDDWAQRYQYQFRVCDSAGSAVLPTGVKAASLSRTNTIAAGGGVK